MSYFETYLTGFIGTSTKYVMLLIMGLFILAQHGVIRVNALGVCFVVWFVYYCVTILWSAQVSDSVSMHFVALLGNVLFTFILSGITFDEKFIRLNLQAHLWCSALFGALSVLFHQAHLSEEYASRQVLTLFGRQNDPNNCAAFLCIGVALAAYGILYDKRFVILNLAVIALNSYATLLTGSRAGLVEIGLIAVVLIFLPSPEKKIDLFTGFKRLFFVAAAVVLVYFLVVRFLPDATLNRLLDFNEFREGSGRREKWLSVLSYVSEKPIFGWGWGGMDFRAVGYIDSAHNTFLTLLCDSGLIGLTTFMIPLIGLLRRGLKTRNALIIILLICGLLPSFFIDAINKRFLWNAIVLSIVLINCYGDTGRMVHIWKPKEKPAPQGSEE